ncbi:hypothetical protein NMY22_g902 [Coprinellus aureogranulatus]|nr:hypothetical protein NMY22_g902 [Coprinellus aureogranulatus]
MHSEFTLPTTLPWLVLLFLFHLAPTMAYNTSGFVQFDPSRLTRADVEVFSTGAHTLSAADTQYEALVPSAPLMLGRHTVLDAPSNSDAIAATTDPFASLLCTYTTTTMQDLLDSTDIPAFNAYNDASPPSPTQAELGFMGITPIVLRDGELVLEELGELPPLDDLAHTIDTRLLEEQRLLIEEDLAVYDDVDIFGSDNSDSETLYSFTDISDDEYEDMEESDNDLEEVIVADDVVTSAGDSSLDGSSAQEKEIGGRGPEGEAIGVSATASLDVFTTGSQSDMSCQAYYEVEEGEIQDFDIDGSEFESGQDEDRLEVDELEEDELEVDELEEECFEEGEMDEREDDRDEVRSLAGWTVKSAEMDADDEKERYSGDEDAEGDTDDEWFGIEKGYGDLSASPIRDRESEEDRGEGEGEAMATFDEESEVKSEDVRGHEGTDSTMETASEVFVGDVSHVGEGDKREQEVEEEHMVSTEDVGASETADSEDAYEDEHAGEEDGSSNFGVGSSFLTPQEDFVVPEEMWMEVTRQMKRSYDERDFDGDEPTRKRRKEDRVIYANRREVEAFVDGLAPVGYFQSQLMEEIATSSYSKPYQSILKDAHLVFAFVLLIFFILCDSPDLPSNIENPSLYDIFLAQYHLIGRLERIAMSLNCASVQRPAARSHLDSYTVVNASVDDVSLTLLGSVKNTVSRSLEAAHASPPVLQNSVGHVMAVWIDATPSHRPRSPTVQADIAKSPQISEPRLRMQCTYEWKMPVCYVYKYISATSAAVRRYFSPYGLASIAGLIDFASISCDARRGTADTRLVCLRCTSLVKEREGELKLQRPHLLSTAMPRTSSSIMYETTIVAEAYEAIQDAVTNALRKDVLKWGDNFCALWKLRVPLIHHHLIMEQGYHMPRKTISARLMTVDARAGLLAVYKRIQSSAGLLSAPNVPDHCPPPLPVMTLVFRELPVDSETYDIFYLVKLAPDKEHVVCDLIGNGPLLGTQRGIHSYMIDIWITGNAFDNIQFNIQTPWRVQITGTFSIKDKNSGSEKQVLFAVRISGAEDEKVVMARLPDKILRKLKDYDMSTTEAIFRFDLTSTSHFQNMILASIHDGMAPISSFRVIMRFDQETQSLTSMSEAVDHISASAVHAPLPAPPAVASRSPAHISMKTNAHPKSTCV